jgi:hypothetical protein
MEHTVSVDLPPAVQEGPLVLAEAAAQARTAGRQLRFSRSRLPESSSNPSSDYVHSSSSSSSSKKVNPEKDKAEFEKDKAEFEKDKAEFEKEKAEFEKEKAAFEEKDAQANSQQTNGETDDGETDDGETDDGETDDGETGNKNDDDNDGNDGSGPEGAGSGAEGDASTPPDAPGNNSVLPNLLFDFCGFFSSSPALEFFSFFLRFIVLIAPAIVFCCRYSAYGVLRCVTVTGGATLLLVLFLQNVMMSSLFSGGSFFCASTCAAYLFFPVSSARRARGVLMAATSKNELLTFVEERKNSMTGVAYDTLLKRIQKGEITTTVEIDGVLSKFSEVPQLITKIMMDLRAESIPTTPDNVKIKLLKEFTSSEAIPWDIFTYAYQSADQLVPSINVPGAVLPTFCEVAEAALPMLFDIFTCLLLIRILT